MYSNLVSVTNMTHRFGKAKDIPPQILESADKHIPNFGKNPLVVYSWSLVGGNYILHIGINRYKGDEDTHYKQHRMFQTNIPRGYFCGFNANGDLLFVSHGCFKFLDIGNDGLPAIYLPDTDKKTFEPTTVVFTEKLNGKFSTMCSFVDDVDGVPTHMCFLTSKTTGTVFPVDWLFQNRNPVDPANSVLFNIYNALMALAKVTTNMPAIIDYAIKNNITFMMEFLDGQHIVPLPHGQVPHLVITQCVQVDQHDVSKSQIVNTLDGIPTNEWLQTVAGVPEASVVKSKTFTIEEFNTMLPKLASAPNLYDPRNPLHEGTIACFRGSSGKALAVVKLKNTFYVLIRMIRQMITNSRYNTATDVHKAVCKRLTGENAYPVVHQDIVPRIAFIAQHLFSWATNYAKTIGVTTLNDMMDYRNPKVCGMAVLWQMFVTANPTLTLESAFNPDAELIGTDDECSQPDVTHDTREPEVIAKGDTFRELLKEHLPSIRDRLLSLATTTTDSNTLEITNLARHGGVVYRVTRYNAVTHHGPVIIYLRGVSGIGKTTLATSFAELYGPCCLVCTADDYWTQENPFDPAKLGHAHRACQQTTGRHLASCVSTDPDHPTIAIVANTGTSPEELKPYADIAYEFGATLLVLEIWSTAKKTDDVLVTCGARGIHVPHDDKGKQILKGQLDRLKNPLPKVSKKTGHPITTVHALACELQYGRNVSPPRVSIVFHLPDETNRHVTLAYGAIPAWFYNWAKDDMSITLYIGQRRTFTTPDGTISCYEVTALLPEDIADCVSYNFVPEPRDDTPTGFVRVGRHMTVLATGTFKPFDSNRLFMSSNESFMPVPVPDDALFPGEIPPVNPVTINDAEFTGLVLTGNLKMN